MEFKCMFATEPVSECPPLKELDRLRSEVRRLEEENRKLRERAVECAGHYKSNAGEVMTTI